MDLFYIFPLGICKHHRTYKICPGRCQQTHVFILHLPLTHCVIVRKSFLFSVFHFSLSYRMGIINFVILTFHYFHNDFLKPWFEVLKRQKILKYKLKWCLHSRNKPFVLDSESKI